MYTVTQILYFRCLRQNIVFRAKPHKIFKYEGKTFLALEMYVLIYLNKSSLNYQLYALVDKSLLPDMKDLSFSLYAGHNFVSPTRFFSGFGALWYG